MSSDVLIFNLTVASNTEAHLWCFGAVILLPAENGQVRPGEHTAQHVAQLIAQGPTHQQRVVEKRIVEYGHNLPHFWRANRGESETTLNDPANIHSDGSGTKFSLFFYRFSSSV